MFEYAISQHKRRPPSRRLLASWAFSCLGHVAMIFLLLEYPQLLRGGMNQWFRTPTDFTSMIPPPKEWRNVAMVGSRMEMPPADELKKYLYDFNRAKPGTENAPPIHVNLPRGILDVAPAAVPKPQPEPGSAGATPPVPLAGGAAGTAPPASGTGAGAAVNPANAGAKPPPVIEPGKIPKGIPETPPAGSGTITAANLPAKDPGATRPPAAGTVGDKPAGQQTGLRVEGNIFIDDKGFNLKDYAELVTQRVKEHWMLPSNLRNYQGNVTIKFYITKDGQIVDARIEILSGNDSLNLSALTAVWDSSPFPPLPRGFPSDRVGARLVFAYVERQ